MAIAVPQGFAADRVRASGDAGQAWIEALPRLVEGAAARWGVTLSDEAPRWRAQALVVFGTRREDFCVLRASWPGHDLGPEVATLLTWDGRGSVRLLECSLDDHVLLLERLDPNRSLDALDITTAAEVIGALIRKLAVPAPSGFPARWNAAQDAASLGRRNEALGSPVPTDWVRSAVAVAETIAADDGGSLVHTDLHSGNVLGSNREPWLAFDPRPSVGHPKQSVPDLLLWRLEIDAPPAVVTDVLDAMTAAGGLDVGRARSWTVIRAVGHWLRCLEEDARLPPDSGERCGLPPRCSGILEALT